MKPSVSLSISELVAENQRLRAEAKRVCAKAKQRGEHLRWLVTSLQRQRQPDFHHPLRDAVQAMHGGQAEHKASFAVRKVRDEETLWDGVVEEFRLTGHRKAKACYAWHYVEGGRRQSFSLLKVAPVLSPQVAVQLALAAREFRPGQEAVGGLVVLPGA